MQAKSDGAAVVVVLVSMNDVVIFDLFEVIVSVNGVIKIDLLTVDGIDDDDDASVEKSI